MSSQSSGFTVWLTGMNGSGKSTLAKYLDGRFRALGRQAEVLEGDEVSEIFVRGLAETKEDRNLLVKRLGYAAKVITRAQGVALVPALSPYRDARDQLRREIGRFVEVFVDCPVETLISRDNTGRYKKAMSGELPNFVGITDPYEPPQNPEVTVHTDSESVADAAQKIFQSLLDLGYLSNDDIKLLVGKKLTAQKPAKGGKKKGGAKAAKAPKAARPRPAAKASGKKSRPAVRAAKTAKKSAHKAR
jgi:adenylylsulfate kinase